MDIGLVDGHVHLEKGPLTLEYCLQFVHKANELGITHLQILDHSHRFKEFEPMYQYLKFIPQQKKWLENKEKKFINELTEYQELIKQVNSLNLPIEVTFGLEVCYHKENEQFIKSILDKYNFDFVVGAVHDVDGILYDMPFSPELLWQGKDNDIIYSHYYNQLFDCVESGLFTQLAHPDTIKLFNNYPSYDMNPTYQKLAELSNKNKIKVECNTGCHYRYNHPDLGLSKQLLQVLINNEVEIITASDAHYVNHVGLFVKEAQALIDEMKKCK